MTDLSPPPGTGTRSRRPQWVIPALVVAVLAIAAGAWWYWGSSKAPEAAAPQKGAGGPGKGAPGKGGPGAGGRFGGFDPNRVQPVAATPARKGDIRIIQTALGTVTASRTVTVKPRVDGPLLRVNFTEGQPVRYGEVLAEIDPAPYQVALAQAEGQAARDQALLNNARIDLERYRTLLAQDSIAKQQVDAQAALVAQYEGTLKVNQANVDNAKLNLSYTKVVAPIAGRTGLRQVDPGNTVRSSDVAGLVVITQVDPISVMFTIPQDALQRVLLEMRQGDKLPVEAWDRDQKNRLVTGILVTTDNQVDVTTGTVKLKAEFPNANTLLFPNQFVNVRMTVDTKKDATLIPASAIQRGPQGTVVYVVKDDNTVGMRPVVLGPQEGTTIEAVSGVQPGERVVTDGIDRLREGAKVEVVQPQGPGGGRGGRGGAGGPPGQTPAGPMAPGKPASAPESVGGTPGVKGGATSAAPTTGPQPQSSAPAKPAPSEGAKPAAAPATPTAPAKPAAPSAAAESQEAFRARMQTLSPEERREAFKKRMESMTPEEREKAREEFRKRREAAGG